MILALGDLCCKHLKGYHFNFHCSSLRSLSLSPLSTEEHTGTLGSLLELIRQTGMGNQSCPHAISCFFCSAMLCVECDGCESAGES